MNPIDAVRATLVRIGFLAGRLAPLRPRVVLATAHADEISGNLAWIRDELRRSHPDVRVVELAQRAPRGARELARAAARSLRAGWLLATARLTVVDDYFFPMYVIRPRRGTKFVQVWHACGAFKRFGYSLGGRSFGAGRRNGAVAIHTNYDLCLVSAARFAPFYAEAFGVPVDRFTSGLGIPRTDLFFDPDRMAGTAAEVLRRYGIPGDRRVVLYAPTFRGARISDARSPDLLDLGELRRSLGEDHVVLLRAHPFVSARTAGLADLGGFVIDVSDHPDINELMLVSDVLVTDYSSAMFEFALLGRPMAFFAPDHDAYEAERGFYIDYASGVPGEIFTTSESLAAHLRAGLFDIDRVRRFAAESFDVADGRASARFIDHVVTPALRGAGLARPD
jgi:CDP-glycerol glycerophosphotransferase (TagB/SpsB family)